MEWEMDRAKVEQGRASVNQKSYIIEMINIDASILEFSALCETSQR